MLQSLQAPKASSNSLKELEEEEEFEDWDAELNLDTNARQTIVLEGISNSSTKVSIDTPKKETKKDPIPQKYKIMETARKNEIEIVK